MEGANGLKKSIWIRMAWLLGVTSTGEYLKNLVSEASNLKVGQTMVDCREGRIVSTILLLTLQT